MNTPKDIEQDVMKTLESLDAIENIAADPFFYTRLQAKIQEIERKKMGSGSTIFGTTNLRLAGIAALMMLNFFSITVVSRAFQAQADDRQTYISAFADEYALSQEEHDWFE